MFTEKELKLLEYALQEVCPWLENEEDFENFNSICKKLNLINLLTDE